MRNWRRTVPLAALAVVLCGWIATRVSVRREAPLVISPPPAASLPPIDFPLRDGRIEGRVVSSGTGVADALVWLLAGDEPHWTWTGADGGFALDSLEAQPWKVFVVARGYAPLRTRIAGAEDARAIDLGPALDPPPSLARLARSSLSGRIASAVKSDLEGCEVVLVPALPPESLDAPLPRRTLVDVTGRFAFEDLIEGSYRVEVLPAWARGGSWPDLARPLGSPLARALAHPPTDSSKELEIPLACGEIRGSVADAGGAAIEGALVLLTPAGDPTRVWPPLSTDGAGAFVARDLPAGAYLVTVRAGAARVERTIEVRAGEPASAVFAGIDVRRAR